ncbi:MAG: SMP-30/gluconolactonase/LRE family protein [Saprospiraceae bacterium]|nr:SMP-30/gluconolactonase/LRE family protein [Saprospiraceae bacterium]
MDSKITILGLCLLLFSFTRCRTSTKNSDTINPPLITTVGNHQASLGEGALWDANFQRFIWIDILGKKVHLYQPTTQQSMTFDTPSDIGTVVPTTNPDLLLVALADGLYTLNLESAEVEPWLDLEKDLTINRFNDGKCDPQGRFWVGSMNYEQNQASGNLYMVNGDKSFEKKLDNITISNGIVWNEELGKMYYIDTPTLNLREFDYSPDGSISNEKVLKTFTASEGYPDGMTIDNNGNLWVGMWNGNKVLCINGQDGSVLDSISMPAHNVTACAFGGQDLDTLYITTASIDMSDEEKALYPKAGSLFKTTIPGVTGRKSSSFKLQK